MTPEERAEKIQSHCLAHGGICSGPEVLSIIASEISAAVEEALIDFSKDANIVLGTSVDAAKAEAYEDAAKIAESWTIWTPEHIEKLVSFIRARAQEVRS